MLTTKRKLARERERAEFFQRMHDDAHAGWARLFRAIRDHLAGDLDHDELRAILNTPYPADEYRPRGLS